MKREPSPLVFFHEKSLSLFFFFSSMLLGIFSISMLLDFVCEREAFSVAVCSFFNSLQHASGPADLP